MKLNSSFVKHTVGAQTLLVPTAASDFHGLIQGNKSVDVILECLQHDTTEEEIVEVMCKRFRGNREIIQADVSDVLGQLKSIGAIDE